MQIYAYYSYRRKDDLAASQITSPTQSQEFQIFKSFLIKNNLLMKLEQSIHLTLPNFIAVCMYKYLFLIAQILSSDILLSMFLIISDYLNKI